MSRYSNTPPVPGDDMVAATENTRFDDFNSATSDINADNVATEGIDRRNLDFSSLSHHVFSEYNRDESGATSLYTIGSVQNINHGGGSSLININGGAGVTITSGDLVRIHYNFHVESWSGGSVPKADNHHGWLVWPVWDIGAGFVGIFGRSDFASLASGTVYKAAGEDHVCFFRASHHYLDAASSRAHWRTPELMHRGSLTFIYSGSDITVTDIQLKIYGYVKLYWDNSLAGSDRRAYADVTNGTDGNALTEEPTLERSQIALIVQRGGNP